MTEAEEIAKFIAERGVTRIEGETPLQLNKPWKRPGWSGNRHVRTARQLRERRKSLDRNVKD